MTVTRNMWKTNVVWLRAVIQMAFVMMGIGVIISTQITKPFLGGGEQVYSMIHHATTDDQRLDSIQILYLLVGALNCIVAFVCALTCFWSSSSAGLCCRRVDVSLEAADDNEGLQLIPDSSDTDPKDVQHWDTDRMLKPYSRKGCILLSLIFAFLLAIHAHAHVWIHLLFTYVYEYLGWSVNGSTLLVAVYQAAHFVVHLLEVPVSRWVSPTNLLVFDLATLLVAGTFML